MAMASLEFDEYVLIWWEQVIERRQEQVEPPITTWDAMKQDLCHTILAISSRSSKLLSKGSSPSKNTTRR